MRLPGDIAHSPYCIGNIDEALTVTAGQLLLVMYDLKL